MKSLETTAPILEKSSREKTIILKVAEAVTLVRQTLPAEPPSPEQTALNLWRLCGKEEEDEEEEDNEGGRGTAREYWHACIGLVCSGPVWRADPLPML